MSYQLPAYIHALHLNNPVIDYTWDDLSPDTCFGDDGFAQEIIKKMEPTDLRAKIALIISIHEWILGRFEGLTTSKLPYEIAEAAWCANIDVNYITYYELDPDEFMGPIEGALYVSMNALLPVLYVSDNVYDIEDHGHEDPQYYYDSDEWKICLKTLIRLVLHILPEPEVFKAWLKSVINRLIENYTQPELDPFANLFGQDENSSVLGDYVPREIFDLAYNYHPDQTVTLLNTFLSQVDKNNPMLIPLAELKKQIKKPYVIQK
ncbi:hypothetical protein RCS94_06305 [Orbaceae bacterium ac157xtp]